MPRLSHEIYIGGSYTHVPDVREDTPVTITRGRRDQGSVTERGKCAVKLNNRHGKYSEDNPLSPFYGQLGVNTSWRTWVQGDKSYLRMSGTGGNSRARVADSPALAVAGDLDVRIDYATTYFPEMSAGWEGTTAELCGRYDTVNARRMWRVLLSPAGEVIFTWSTNGTDFNDRFSTETIPTRSGIRLAVRVTLDVNNGAGGHTVRFYTADSLAGPWDQLGDSVVTAGTTSVNTTGPCPLDVGDIETLGSVPLRGRVYGFQLRNGVDGAPVADADFTGLAPGTTSWADSAGRDWTLSGDAHITDYYRRFRGEVPSWPQSWDQSGNDCWTSIEVAGPLRRLDKGSKPLQSTLRKRVPSGSPLAYWPLEDGRLTTRPTNVVDNGGGMTLKGVDFAADDSMLGSAPLPTLRSGGEMRATVNGASAGGWHVEMPYKLGSLPSSAETMLRVDFAGSASNITSARLLVGGTDGIRLQLLDDDDKEIWWATISDAQAKADFAGAWNRLQVFTAPQGGGRTGVYFGWRNVLTGIWWYIFRDFEGNPGRVQGVRAAWGSSMQGLSFGHLGVFDTGGSATGPTPGVTIYNGADDGFNGEWTAQRIRRVTPEERIPIMVSGFSSDGTRLGPQRVATAMDTYRDIEATDGGVLQEVREDIALEYVQRSKLYNRPVALVLDQAQGQIAAPLDPIRDDSDLVNELTVQRLDGGSSEPAILPAGHPLSVERIGLYDRQETYNLYSDEQTDDQAPWRLSLRTVGEARVPTVTINMTAPGMAALRQRVLDYVDCQSIIEIRNTLFRPDPIRLVVEGYTERMSATVWTIELNCSPAAPWEPGVYGVAKADSAGSYLAAPISETETALTLDNPGDNEWTDDPAELPWDIRVGGEVMNVRAVTALVSDDFSRTVSDGWGTSPIGSRPWWTTSGGTLADYSVAGGAGRHTIGTRGDNRLILMDQPASDFDMRAITATSAAATGDAIQSYLVARLADTSNYYAARVDFAPGGIVTLTMTRIVGGAPFAHPSVQVATGVGANVPIAVRFQGQGSLLRARAWLSTDPEPAEWHTSVTETDLTARGLCGVRSRVLAGNTNALPLVVAWDNFTMPQLMSVTRSANGIVKPHSAGARVQLASPAVVGY